MRKFLVLMVFLASSLVYADSDPCELNQYPVKWKSDLSHPVSYELPAIFYKTNNSKVIVSVSKAINFAEGNMETHKPYLKSAKEYIINSLSELPKNKLVDHSNLWITTKRLQGQELNKAIHVMAGYHGLFEGLLLNNEASVSINEKLIASSNTVYMIGKGLAPVHGLGYVHKLIVSNSNDIIFSKCWLDSK
ncbi:hypothetical protein EXT48_16955 [Pseudoalteromonas sp. CO348]|uniref:hypothetical protein n=1 Tax=unclassified Pseudoalteromonas TaxID=194690 RepID=UPI0010231360|nr:MULTISPECIES: hypothetical protein [unclassified Pseudoalteromonas]MCG7541070.1 hypothetical protein [Pseudoalteromonas sp. OF7H-1]RZG01016.1 hypothetical protein EXT48_16955 [Pseudoalteromonas sp. CO348]